MMFVLIILAAVWVAVLVPPFVRSRREGRPDNSVVSFRAQLSTLERATPGTSLRNLPPGSATIPGMGMAATPQYLARERKSATQRRRDVLTGLLAVSVLSLLLRFFVAGTFTTVLLLLSVAATAAYVYALRQRHLRAVERVAKVHPLRRHNPPAPLALRRTAAN